MRLQGIHHITAITADAQRNLYFYGGVLGLRFVKKTVNFDAPDVYHLYYADELGSPGSVITFFEFPGAAQGSAGAGMIHRIALRAARESSLEFWADRLAAAGVETQREGGALRFADPEGLEFEIRSDRSGDRPLAAHSGEIPAEHALRGFDGVRAYTAAPESSLDLLGGKLGFSANEGDSWRIEGEGRRAFYAYDEPPELRPVQGAGTVHHIAFACQDSDHKAWRERALSGGADVTPIIDRRYFRSIYFREPSGVLFEIATKGPGFAVDEPRETLGERLMLPPQHEHLRSQLERSLTPLVNPRTAAREIR